MDKINMKELIAASLLTLLKNKDYNSITTGKIAETAHIGRRTFYRYFQTKDDVMKYTAEMLMDRFAETLLKNNAEGLRKISKSYFEFWENNIDTLLLLKKAHLLYFIEDNLPALVQQVAIKVNHDPNGTWKTFSPAEKEKYQYMFLFRLAGFWKLTIVWCEENPRKSPEQMSRLIQEIIQ